jgi:hypothetical protein
MVNRQSEGFWSQVRSHSHLAFSEVNSERGSQGNCFNSFEFKPLETLHKKTDWFDDTSLKPGLNETPYIPSFLRSFNSNLFISPLSDS